MEANDRNRILNMLKDGKITVEEADSLLGALDNREKPAESLPLKDPRGRKGRKLKVEVDAGDRTDGKGKVNVNIPLSLVKTIGPIVMRNLPKEARQKLDESGVNVEEILGDVENLIDSGIDEDIVNIDAGEEGDHAKVRIYVE